MQGIAHTAPATAILLTLPFTASHAGLAAPLAYLIALLIVLMLGVGLTQLARQMPSAGGYYTYVSRTVGPRAGFLTAWLFFLYTAITPAFSLVMMGWVLESALRAEYGIVFPWWLFLLLGRAFTFWATYRGIEVSAAALMVLGCLEMGIVVFWRVGAWSHRARGASASPSFNPAHAPSGNGLYLGIIFSLFALTGWEGVVPLAEESENPRHRRAASDRGHDPDHGGLSGLHLVGDPDRLGYGRPQGAGRLQGVAPVRPGTAILGTPVGSSSCSHCSTRCSRSPSPAASSRPGCGTRWRGPGRCRVAGGDPPRHKTPVNAVTFQAVVTLVGGLGLGSTGRPGPGLLPDGNGLDPCLALIYGAGNLGVFLLIGGTGRSSAGFCTRSFR